MRYTILAIALLFGISAEAQVIRAEPFYTAPGEAVTLLLDAYPGAAVAYSLRKLDKDYTGSAIRVRRSSDNTEQDIGFFNNYLDTAAMKTFVGNNNGFVVTWYNQADSAGVFGIKNATNSTALQQPRILTSGALNYEGGEVCLLFDGSNDYFEFAPAISPVNSIYSAFSVGKRVSSGTAYFAFGAQGNGGLTIAHLGNNNFYFQRSTGYLESSSSNTTSAEMILTGISRSSSQYQMLNNSTITSSFVNLALANSIQYIARYNTSGNYHNGMFKEILIYSSDQDANVSGIHSNMNTFYTIY